MAKSKVDKFFVNYSYCFYKAWALNYILEEYVYHDRSVVLA